MTCTCYTYNTKLSRRVNLFLMFPLYEPLQMMPLQPVLFPNAQPPLTPPQQAFPLPATPQPLLQHPQPFQQPQPQIHLQPPKTVYILSYSSSVLKHNPGASAQLVLHLPHGIPALLTVYCQTWRAPPAEMCRLYSGISPQIQNFLLRSRTAVREMYVPFLHCISISSILLLFIVCWPVKTGRDKEKGRKQANIR